MELLQNVRKLTSEERKKEVREQMYAELKAMEMDRRHRVALETMEKSEERQMATESWGSLEQREEKERRANEQQALKKVEQEQLKREKLQWEKVMMVDEPRYTLSAQKTEEEAELCCVHTAGVKISPEPLTSDLKAKDQGKKKTLHNNWVVEQKMNSVPVKQKLHPNSSTYLLFSAKPAPKPEEKTHSPKPKKTLEWLQEKLKIGYWVEKYQDYRQKKDEKRKLKAEEQR